MESNEKALDREFVLNRIYLCLLIIAVVGIVTAGLKLFLNIEVGNYINVSVQNGAYVQKGSGTFSINFAGVNNLTDSKVKLINICQGLRNGLGQIPMFIYAFLFIRLDNLKGMSSEEDASGLKLLRIGLLIHFCYMVVITFGFFQGVIKFALLAILLFYILGLIKLIKNGTIADKMVLKYIMTAVVATVNTTIISFLMFKPNDGFKAYASISFILTILADASLILAYAKART